MTQTAINKNFTNRKATVGVSHNLLWMVWSGTISIANSIVLWIFMARMRDVEEMGRFTIVMGLYALFYNVCSLGLMPFLVNEISRRIESEDNSTLPEIGERKIVDFISAASTLLLLSGIVCAVLMTVCGFLASESWSVRISTLILSFAIIPTGLICVSEAAAISFNRTRLIASVSTLENVLRTVIPFALIWYGFDISVVFASFVAVRIIAIIPYISAARSKLALFNFRFDEFRKIIGAAPTFAGTIILASVNWQAATILLGFLSTETESGKYGVASRFLIPVSILMASYANVIQPVLARRAQQSIGDAGSYLSKILRYPLMLSVTAAIVSPFLSVYVLTIFFGKSYGDASVTLDILAMSVVPFCLVMIISRGLVAANSQHIDFYANAAGVFACITSGMILIPRYGATGAAAAQLISFLLMAALEAVYLSKKLIGFNFWRKARITSLCLAANQLIIWNI